MTATNGQVRAACYCRISSDPKDRREGVGRQREDTAILCELKGWRIADFYIDNDRSASNGKKRPEWERLLADVEAGRIDAVAAWDQDRVNRMMDDFQRYKKLFVQRGILLATSNNGDIDLSTPSGVLTATIKTAVAEHEISMMKIRMRRAARQKAERGIPKWKQAFGYLEDSYQPDPVTAPLVQEAYASVLAGGSITDIARAWNAAGIYGLNGKPWSASTVSLFLRKARNAGLRSHTHDGKTEIVGKGTWPPLVNESTWKAAQSVLNAPGRAPGRKSVRKHLLTGVLRCGKCDSTLSGRWVMQDNNGHSITYTCKGCRGVSIRGDRVEPLIYGVVAGRLAKPDAVDLLKAEIHDEAEAEALRVEANTLLGRLNEIADERADGLIDGKGYRTMVDRINAKLDAISRKQQDAERVRVFDGLPLGKPAVAEKVRQLSADRLRAVIDVLVQFVVQPVGKGHRVNGERFDPERVQVIWR